MKKLTKYCINRLNGVELHTLVPGAEGAGMTRHAACPKCGASGKKKSKYIGLDVVDDIVRNKHLVKCHSCGFGAGGGAINVMMEMYGLKFQEACTKIADMSGISLEYEADRTTPKKDDSASFVARQLEASGLTFDDVKATVYVNDDMLTLSPFRRGSLDIATGHVNEADDEMLILYYDLNGRRRQYMPKRNRTKPVEYTRVRWSNPEARAVKGKAVKYQTPLGAKSEIYIPQKVRTLYQNKAKFDTLFIQEGEKKAEKACKHGLMSVAIQGIGNIGRADEGLPPDIQYIAQICGVKNIVMLMDADWADLKHELHDNDRVDSRPRDFARALVKFKKFIGTLSLCKLDIDIWFAHINQNDRGDKGIDDLLTGTLKGREDTIAGEVRDTMATHDGHGEHIDIINITSYSDNKILGLWDLNSAADFFDRHRARLEDLHTFKFANVFYKNVDGRFTPATDYGTGTEFWSVSYDDKGQKKVKIDLIDMLSFLSGNGYRSLKKEDGSRGFVRIEGGIIKPCDEYDIRSFILSYVYRATKDHTVHLRFAETIGKTLSNTNLCQLELLVTAAGLPTRETQTVYFKNRQIAITHNEISEDQLTGPVWASNLINRDFERIRIFEDFAPDGDGGFTIRLTDAGHDCEFLSFLSDTCNFWRGLQFTDDRRKEYTRHLANKITCLGYLLRDYKADIEAKAVIAMDAAMSDVGFSKGRTGKSFIGKAISKLLDQTVIDGRNLANDDPYMFSGVTRTTKSIFIDDINPTFDIGRFYQRITSDLNVNIKQGGRFVVPFEKAPKFFLTTNHAIDNIDESAAARVIFMAFSDFYSYEYTPHDRFGHMLFTEWDDRQWLLFDNFMAECIMIYMRSVSCGWAGSGMGAVPPPMADLSRRALRQEMGELFLSWAESYFNPEGGHLNMRIVRRNMFEAFLAEYGQKATALSAKTFKAKIIAFCKFMGYHFNAHKKNSRGSSFYDVYNTAPGASFIGERDLAQSLEYFTISTTQFNIDTQQ